MIRPATTADIPAILDIYAPYVSDTAITFEYVVPGLTEFTKRFADITAQFPWLVWEEDGEVLGYAYGSRAFERAAYQWDADLSVYLQPKAAGRGIGRALYEAVEEYLRRQGYVLLYGLVTSANERSCGFHEALGFKRQAVFPACGLKFGQWHDIIWYEKRLREDVPTTPPISWKEVL